MEVFKFYTTFKYYIKLLKMGFLTKKVYFIIRFKTNSIETDQAVRCHY